MTSQVNLIVLRQYSITEPCEYGKITFDCLQYNEDTLDRVRKYVSIPCDGSYRCDFEIISGSDALIGGYIAGLKSLKKFVQMDRVTINVYNIGDDIPGFLLEDWGWLSDSDY